MPNPIPFRHPTTTARLDAVRGLIDSPHFDIDAAINILHALPIGLDAECEAAVYTAVRLVAAAGHGGSRVAVARFALAQVVVLLERERGVVS